MERNNTNQIANERVVSLYYYHNSKANIQLLNSIITKGKFPKKELSIQEFSALIGQIYEKELENSHATGSYYTPPELTRWICESIICKMVQKEFFLEEGRKSLKIDIIKNWIQTESKSDILIRFELWMKNLRICDNACGTGEFLIQLIDIISTLLQIVENQIHGTQPNESKNFIWKQKKEIIEKMVYGIDRNPDAVEITTFRLWLEGFSPENVNQEPFPITNNIRCGDSLMALQWQNEFPEIFSSNCNIKIGFDLIIGNPPYIKSRKSDWEVNSGSKSHLLEYYRKKFPTLAESLTLALDYSMYFILNSIDLLREGGWNCYLITNKWIRTAYGQPIRQIFSDGIYFDSLIELSDSSSFKNANVDLCIYFIQKSNERNFNASYAKLYPVAEKSSNQDDSKMWKEFNQLKLGIHPWNFNKTELDEEIFSWLSQKHSEIKSKGFIYGKGLETGANTIFTITSKQRSEFLQQNSLSSDLIKPFILGEGISPYEIQWDEKWILFIPWHFPYHETNKLKHIDKAEEAFQLKFPEIYNFLKKFKTELIQRAPSEQGHYEWYTLKRYAASYYQYFSQPKIMWQELAAFGKFAWDPIGFFPGNSAYMITQCPPALTIILNSNVVDFYFGHISKTIGKNARRHTAKFIERIVIPDIPVTLTPLIEYIQFSHPEINIIKKIEALTYELYFIDKFIEDGFYPHREFYILNEFIKDLDPIYYIEWSQFGFQLKINPLAKENALKKAKLEAEMNSLTKKYFIQILKNEIITKWENIIYSHPWIQYLEQKRLKHFKDIKTQ